MQNFFILGVVNINFTRETARKVSTCPALPLNTVQVIFNKVAVILKSCISGLRLLTSRVTCDRGNIFVPIIILESSVEIGDLDLERASGNYKFDIKTLFPASKFNRTNVRVLTGVFLSFANVKDRRARQMTSAFIKQNSTVAPSIKRQCRVTYRPPPS